MHRRWDGLVLCMVRLRHRLLRLWPPLLLPSDTAYPTIVATSTAAASESTTSLPTFAIAPSTLAIAAFPTVTAPTVATAALSTVTAITADAAADAADAATDVVQQLWWGLYLPPEEQRRVPRRRSRI